MALPFYTYNSIPTDSEFNAFLRPVFDKDEAEEEFPGHLRRLRDTALSNDSTQIKKRWEKFEQELLVTIGSGLSVNYTGGAVILPGGGIATIAPGAISLSDNATSFVYVTQTGGVAAATIRPVFALVLAQVTTVSGAVTTIIDLRPRFVVAPRTEAIKVFGGLGDENNFTLSGAQTLSRGEYYFRNFTITSTGALTIDRFARIYCSGQVSISGSINITPASPGGPFMSNFTVMYPSIPGQGMGAGSYNYPGGTYSYAISPVGSGGAGGIVNPNGTGTASNAPGGSGGGGLIIEAAGSIDLAASATITANGTNGGTLTAITGSAYGGGGGGGSGGLILLKSLVSITCLTGCTLSVRAGSGGNGTAASGAPTQSGTGGGGGGGGVISLQAPVINNGATQNLQGGAPGSNGSVNAPSVGGGGGGSFGGAGGQAAGNPTAGSAGVYLPLTIRPII